MAGETYYFAFSLIAIIGMVLHIINLTYFKLKGKTILGEEFKPGTDGYKKFKHLTSVQGVTITALIGVILVVNMAYCIYRILHLDNPEYARFILYFSIGLVLFTVVMFAVMRDKLKADKQR